MLIDSKGGIVIKKPLLALLLCLLLGSCASEGDPNTVVVREKLFVQQCADIYENPQNYDGKNVVIEGMLDVVREDGRMYYYVYRYTSDACCPSKKVGFEVEYSGEKFKQDTWVRAEGVFRATQNSTVLLVLTELRKTTAGKIFV